ncbi:2-amino-4-hydroxy-6-hydroxymethyldihydropteridine diphosphokinase [Zavarzinia sp.]|uniref:2-amino-4-hydroxy-6- hydroxymethyldihydropteridine diphosphokinase n=1 Tax=Zavarzinia sp. TaxID=2027920 RepID=UPI0035690308
MILVGLGANLPDLEGRGANETLSSALQALRGSPDLQFLAASRMWESAPVPVSDQPWYVNAVAAFESALAPREVLALLHRVEADFGRRRTVRNAARVLDLDLLAVDDLVTGCDQMAELVLPHPRMAERAFVLLPLRDIVPGWRHPATGETIDGLIAALDPTQVCRPLAA